MRYFFDTEFVEDGRKIELLSIGMVAQDGRELYLEAICPEISPSEWVQENVIPHLDWYKNPRGAIVYRKKEIADLVYNFVAPHIYGKPEFWAYYASYDHIVLCQLYGTMMDLPPDFPKHTNCIKQYADMLGGIRLPKNEEVEHHALSDARWAQKAFNLLDFVGRELTGIKR